MDTQNTPPSRTRRLDDRAEPHQAEWIARILGYRRPLGFEPGDGNLYRYAGNRTTNATDPSGLQRPGEGAGPDRPGEGPYQDERIEDYARRLPRPGGQPYVARIHFESLCSTDDDSSRRRDVLFATGIAASRIDRALFALRFRWPEIQRLLANDFLQFIFEDNKRFYYIFELWRVYTVLTTPGTISMTINAEQRGDGPAYVRGVPGLSWGTTIYINPRSDSTTVG